MSLGKTFLPALCLAAFGAILLPGEAAAMTQQELLEHQRRVREQQEHQQRVMGQQGQPQQPQQGQPQQPQQRAAAQPPPQQQQRQQGVAAQRQRQEQLERERRQWHQQRYGRTVEWDIQVINAVTFERMLYTDVRSAAPSSVIAAQEWVALTARNVNSPEEARWNIRRQLGFPADSDMRIVGGVSQRILWGAMRDAGAPVQAAPAITVEREPIAQPQVVEERRRRRWPLVAAIMGVAALVIVPVAVL